jgi:alpha-D-ribose 1-methylphosphonate 5-triphosphate diphosphatase
MMHMLEQVNVMGCNLLIENARVVLADRVVENGWVAIEGGRIVEIGDGHAPERGINFFGDYLMPGLVELHTDHLEAHIAPRPKVMWDPVAAVIAYDGQLAVSGITTVLDSLRIWKEEDESSESVGQAGVLADAIDTARKGEFLRVEHFLHLRCEIPMPYIVSETTELIGRSDVRLVSLMDHTPGQRQFRDEEKLRTYYRGKSGGITDAQLDVMFQKRIDYQQQYAAPNLREIVALAHAYNVPLASHDDTTMENVADALRDRVSVAEFPTTLEAARSLHEAGVDILMGAPNVVRGGSHSGNIAAITLAREGILDILSSDYVPASLLSGALQLTETVPHIDLPAAIRTVTYEPARAVGLTDRGEIAVGKRADVIRVHRAGSATAVRGVWRTGVRVA